MSWTATNFWGERPPTDGVNGQFAVKSYELVCEIVPNL